LDFSGHRSARFGVFAADLRERTLTKSGRSVAIQDQPFRLLAVLLRQPGLLVTREEVRKAVWPDGTTVDFERGLNTALNKLRTALGDSADSPRFVETVPRRGYRFLAPVEWLSEETDEPQRPAGSARVSALPRWLAASLVSVLIVGAGVAALSHLGLSRSARPSKLMLAILPFTDLSSSPGQEYFSTGLTDEMISRLGGMSPSQLGVIARSTVMGYRTRERPVGEMVEELGVDYFLEGSVRRAGDRVRITAQLIRVDDETALWAETYESTLHDVLATQRQVAERIADSLAVDVLHVSERDRSVDPEAHDAYLKGLHYRDMLTEAGYRKAIEQFDRAISIDPGFAPAYAAMSACYCLLAGHGLEVDEPSVLMERTRQLATQALALDENLAEAHGTLGMAYLKYQWDWSAAERELRRAAEINPSDPMASTWYSFYLSSQGRHDEAIAQAERARRSDPVARISNVNLGWQYYEARQYGAAIRAFEETLALFPDFWIAYWGKGVSLLGTDQGEEALRYLQRAVDLSEESSAALGALSLAYATLSNTDRSLEILDRLLTRTKTGYVPPGIFVPIYAKLGDLDRAFGWLEKAYEVRSRSLVWIKVSHDFDALRGDPRYHEIVRRMGLQEAPDAQSE